MSSESSQGLVTRLALIAAIGGLLFGYDSAVIAAIGTPVDIHFIAPRHLSATAASSLSGMVVVAVLVGLCYRFFAVWLDWYSLRSSRRIVDKFHLFRRRRFWCCANRKIIWNRWFGFTNFLLFPVSCRFRYRCRFNLDPNLYC